MSKYLSQLVWFLVSLAPTWVLAAVQEKTAADAPPDMVDTVYVVIFGVGFIGMIVGFFVYLWWIEKKKAEKAAK